MVPATHSVPMCRATSQLLVTAEIGPFQVGVASPKLPRAGVGWGYFIAPRSFFGACIRNQLAQERGAV